MTIGSGVPYNLHTGNGVTTTFAYGFTVLAAADLVATVNGAPASVVVNNVGVPAGGTVDFSVAPANGAEIILKRVLTLQRLVEYQTNGDLLATTINADLDRLLMLIQGVSADAARSLRAPFPESLDDLPAAALRANTLMAWDSNGQATTALPVSGSATDLALNLLNATDPTKGDVLIGSKLELAGAVASNQHAVNEARIVDLKSGFGAVLDGVADDTAKLNAAIAALPGGGIIRIGRGTLKLTASVTLTNGIKLWGEGKTTENTIDGATRILRAFAGADPTIVIGNDAGLWDLDIDNALQGTGECFKLIGQRAQVKVVSTRRSGGDGSRVGTTEGASSINANCWWIEGHTSINNVGKACYIHHSCTTPGPDTGATQSATTTNGSTAITLAAPNANLRKGQTVSGTGIAANTIVVSCSGTALVVDTAATASGTNTLSFTTWPDGIPDVNAGTMIGSDYHHNGDNLVVENAIDCFFFGLTLQSATGKGLWLKRNARGHKLNGVYTELNGVEGQVDLGAKYNYIRGNRFTLTDSGWVISDSDNDIELFDNALEGLTSTSYKRNEIAIYAPATGGEARLSLHAESGKAKYGQLFAKKGAGAGGTVGMRGRNTSGVLVDRVFFDQDGLGVMPGTAGMLFGKTVVDVTTPGIHVDSSRGRIDSVNTGTGADTRAAFYNGNGNVGRIETSGTATNYVTSSDAEQKENIVDAPDAGPLIDAIRVRSFDWKSGGGHVTHGVVAQELYEVYPDAVAVGNEKYPWGVDPSKLVWLLLHEVQSLRARVAALEAQP